MTDMQTDISVLKTEVGHLADVISKIGTKMDVLLSMQVQLVQLQERHDYTKEQLDIANKRITSAHILANDTSVKVTKYYSFVNGVLLTGALFFGFIQWYVISQINHISDIDTSIRMLTHRIDKIVPRDAPVDVIKEATANE